MGTSALLSDRRLPSTCGVLELDSVRRSDLPVVGGRALRLAIATQAGLPVPAGSIVTASLLGCHSVGRHVDAASTARELDIIFDELGHGGRTPLAVSLSSLSAQGGCADRVPSANDITTRSDLLHAVRRFSVTATILGDRVAAIVQRHVPAVQSGTFLVCPHQWSGSLDGAGPEVQPRLRRLHDRAAQTFHGVRLVTWSVDSAGQLWLVDVGPDQAHDR